MATSDAQKSEVHATTGDAASSPQAGGDRDTTGRARQPGHGDDRPQWPLDPPTGGMEVVRDDTDAGGPLVIKSEDPNLNPPRAPRDPFPTDRKPEIDPPVRPGG